MAESLSNSSRFGQFDSLSARLDNLDSRLAEATPPAVVMPVLRKSISGVYFGFNPAGWDGGGSGISTLFLNPTSYTQLPPWRPEEPYVMGLHAVAENGLVWTPEAFAEDDSRVVINSSIDHPRFFRSTLEAADGDIWWTAEEPDENSQRRSHIVSLEAGNAPDGRVVVIYVTTGDGIDLGASEASGATAPGLGLLQGAHLLPGEAATYLYDAQAKTWLLIDIRLS